LAGVPPWRVFGKNKDNTPRLVFPPLTARIKNTFSFLNKKSPQISGRERKTPAPAS